MHSPLNTPSPPLSSQNLLSVTEVFLSMLPNQNLGKNVATDKKIYSKFKNANPLELKAQYEAISGTNKKDGIKLLSLSFL